MSIIIDTDPGVDDALALSLAVSSNLNIAGITTVYGNSTLVNSTRNVLTILQILRKNIPVYQGAFKPLYGNGIKAASHGDNGLGGFRLKNLKNKVEKQNAIDMLITLLEKKPPKSVEIICIGPVTNIALASILRPDLVQKIKRIIILGGVFSEKGNISPYAEFNTFNDPFALENILNIKCDKILIPINICRKIIISKDDFSNIKNKNLRNTFKIITNIYISYYTSNIKYGGFKGGVMYDILAIVYLINPALFTTTPKYVQVELYGKRAGKTSCSNSQKPNCLVVKQANGEKIKNLFFNYLNKNV